MRKVPKRAFIFYSFFTIVIMILLGSIMNQLIVNNVELAATVDQLTETTWILIFFATFLLLILIFFLNYNTYEKYIKPIRNVSVVAKKLADGKYNARTYEAYYDDARMLASSINLLARNLQEMSIKTEIQNSHIAAVIDNMNSGLMLINEKGYIQLINRAFLHDFEGDSSDYIGYLYYDALSYEEIQSVVKDVFMLEETVQKTLIISSGIEQKYLAISGAPIFNNQKWKGVVLVFHNITEHKKLEEMRKDFVANVSHELKTPITSIKGFAETLLGGAKDDPEALTQFLQIINKESERMQNLIQDLLELSKLEKEDYQLKLEDINLKNLVEDVKCFVQYTAEEKNIHLEMELDQSYPIRVEPSKITQLLLNLVMNAIHYTKEGGRVKLTAKDTDEYVKISIEDTGIGIPKEELPRIFERFYRVDKARSRNSGGTGLGLAIVKHIVEAHGGKIEVESQLGKGTTFHIYLQNKIS
ncbi:two-component system histidine kinase PnpS [Salirhabdus sp. Marseille-P4669]|uniref:two-component system histidine kinase PnpS n=1 Tax=Salirhabdus sp. Marseille-P4669 TaxID=2042310 RepID=UPI000C7D761E|nr:ATP-binding protein [Salirhabdus sp. Marseille-P4669]